MTAAETEYLEAVCKEVYEPSSSEQRAAAEKALTDFAEKADCFQRCIVLLDRGSNPYSQLVASSTLMKLVARPSLLSLEQKMELHKYLLNYILTRPKLEAFVLSSLCQLFARITKIGWFDRGTDGEYLFRSCVVQLTNLGQDSPELCHLAVQILSRTVVEMNQQEGFVSNAKFRYTAVSFRDDYLFEIFELSLRLLRSIWQSIESLSYLDENQSTLIKLLLNLCESCLSYDFLGSVVDETSDDNFSIQVPPAWSVAFTDTPIVKLFYGFYGVFSFKFATPALSCLVQLACVRRTLFTASERQTYLSALIEGVAFILENNQGLSEPSAYHEFCRLVARIKSNYQLIELLKVESYPKFLQLITEFTVRSLQLYQFSSNSIHYLLSFWQRMVSSMPYVRSSEPHKLKEYAPLVTKAYIESRLDLPATVLNSGCEDPLDDQGVLQAQMEQLSVIGRCEYEKSCQILAQFFDQVTESYQRALTQSNRMEITIAESKLAWLTYCFGSAIGGHIAFSSSEDLEAVDGDLICRIFGLIRLTDSHLPSHVSKKLEHSYLAFLEQFRKAYFSDQCSKISMVYKKLEKTLGLSDEKMVLAVLMEKIITNIKFLCFDEKLIDESLVLLTELSMGYTTVRKLVALPQAQFLLENHTGEHFPFLGRNSDLTTMKSRTKFYTVLVRLLTIDMTEDVDRLLQFFLPFTNAFNELGKLFTMSDSALESQMEAKRIVIGLARDIRGVAFACNTKSAFVTLFDWIYPNYLSMLVRSIEIWYADATVMIPVLRLMAEFCQNRSQRLQFDVCSPSAYLLFKEASRLICSYGSRILSLTNVPADQMYRTKLKGLMICFYILRSAVCGSYINFGVFRLYGDSCLDDLLNMFIKMVLSISRQDLFAYPKLSQNYFALLESLSFDHITFLGNLEPDIFIYLLQTLQEGLSSLDAVVCSCCCSTLDNIVHYLYRRFCRINKARVVHAGVPPENDNCLHVLQVNPEILRQLLSTILNIIIFEDCRCQWAMTRPLLGLIFLQEDYFNQCKLQMIRNFPADKQAALLHSFDGLMDGIERNLTVKNFDRLSQNMAFFKREISECLKGIASDPLMFTVNGISVFDIMV